LEVFAIEIPVAIIELISQMNTLEGSINFYQKKNSTGFEEEIPQTELMIILDPIFVQHCVPIRFKGVITVNDDSETFDTTFVAAEISRSYLFKGTVFLKKGEYTVHFRSFPVGIKDHEVQYDEEEGYDRRLIDILNESVKDLTENLKNGLTEKAYELMSPTYQQLVNLETYGKTLKEAQLELKKGTMKSCKNWNIHHQYPCATVMEMEREDGNFNLTFVMHFNKEKDKFDCLNIRLERKSREQPLEL